jgi:hypothetical protein
MLLIVVCFLGQCSYVAELVTPTFCLESKLQVIYGPSSFVHVFVFSDYANDL